MTIQTTTRTISQIKADIDSAKFDFYAWEYELETYDIDDARYDHVYQAMQDSEKVLNTLRDELAAANKAVQAEAVVEIEQQIENAELELGELEMVFDKTDQDAFEYDGLYEQMQDAKLAITFLRIDLSKAQELDLS